MSRTGQVRTKNIIEYGACGHLYSDDYEKIIDGYNELLDANEYRIYCCADDVQWEFDIKDVEKLIRYFTVMDDLDLENFIKRTELCQTKEDIKQFVTDMKNWLEDGKKAGQDYIIIDWI